MTDHWRPIATAPRDGTSVLLYDPDLGETVGLFWPPNWFWGNEEIDIFPTHWMPLPEPPEGDE